MRLLPKFRHDGNAFNLQPPFTANGRLIVDIRANDVGDYLIIDDYNNRYRIQFSDPAVCSMIDNIFDENISHYGHFYVEYDNRLKGLPIYNHTIYLEKIKKQCDTLNNAHHITIQEPPPSFTCRVRPFNYKEYCIFILKRRGLAGKYYSDPSYTLCDQNTELYSKVDVSHALFDNRIYLSENEYNRIYNNNTTNTTLNTANTDQNQNSPTNTITIDPTSISVYGYDLSGITNIALTASPAAHPGTYYTTHRNENSSTESYQNESSLNSQNYYSGTGIYEAVFRPFKQPNYIHSFNYIPPEYMQHFLPGEDKTTTLLLGIEIEVAGNISENEGTNRNNVVKKCIQIMNGSDSDKEDLIYCTQDSTVQIELDTMPCSLAYHKKKMNYKELFKYLDLIGYKGHDCENAGLHIHANRSYLGDTILKQQLVISKILLILEWFNDEICVIARRKNDYSRFVGNKDKEDSAINLYGKYKDTGKRAALNLSHKDTIEFRCFKSTLKYETLLLTLEFVKVIIDFAKATNIEQIECIRWDDIMNKFSPELREYYLKRKMKQKEKEEKEVIKGNDTSAFTATNGLNRGLHAQLYEDSSDSNETPDETPIDLNFYHTLSEYLISSINEVLSGTNNDELEVTPDNCQDVIADIKRKIKKIKNQLKHCSVYQEKQRLNRELNEWQKELKKIKRMHRYQQS